VIALHRALLVATAVGVTAVALYPPFTTTEEHVGPPVARGWVFAPLNRRPTPGATADAEDLDYLRRNPEVAAKFYHHFGYLPRDLQKAYPYVRIDLNRLVVEWLGIVLVGGLLYLAARPSSLSTTARLGPPPLPRSAAMARATPHVSTPVPPPLEPLPAAPPAVAASSPMPPPLPAVSARAREAAKGFDPLSWQMVVGALLMAVNFKVWLDLYPVAPGLAFGLWALTAPYFVWTAFGCPPYLSRRAREYRRHCEPLDLPALEQKLLADNGDAECRQWQITPKQRQAVLDEILERRFDASQG
jgi:hypothetical protein